MINQKHDSFGNGFTMTDKGNNTAGHWGGQGRAAGYGDMWGRGRGSGKGTRSGSCSSSGRQSLMSSRWIEEMDGFHDGGGKRWGNSNPLGHSLMTTQG